MCRNARFKKLASATQSITQKSVYSNLLTAREREHWILRRFGQCELRAFRASIARTRLCAIPWHSPIQFRGLLDLALVDSVSVHFKNARVEKCVFTFVSSEMREPLACRSAHWGLRVGTSKAQKRGNCSERPIWRQDFIAGGNLGILVLLEGPEYPEYEMHVFT